MDSLIENLKGDREIRQQAADMLVKIGKPAVLPLLVAIKKDDRNESVVEYEHRILRRVLIKIGEPAFQALVKALKKQSSTIRGRAAVKTLVLFNDLKVIEPLVEVMLSKDYPMLTRTYAIDALAYFKDPRAFESLIAALQDEEVPIRGHAAIALGEYRDKRALEPLRASLNHSGPCQWMDWRKSVLEAIEAISNPDYRVSNRGFFINCHYHELEYR